MANATPTNPDAVAFAAVDPVGGTVSAFATRSTYMALPVEHVPPGLGHYAAAECARLEAAVKEARRNVPESEAALRSVEKAHERDTVASVAAGNPAPSRASLDAAAVALDDAKARLVATMRLRGQAVGRLHRLMLDYRAEYLSNVADNVRQLLDDLDSGGLLYADAVAAIEALISGATRYAQLNQSTGGLIGSRVAPLDLPAHSAAEAPSVLRTVALADLGRALGRVLDRDAGPVKPGTEDEGAVDPRFAAR